MYCLVVAVGDMVREGTLFTLFLFLLNLKPRDAFMYFNSVLPSCLADSSANQLHGGGALMY